MRRLWIYLMAFGIFCIYLIYSLSDAKSKEIKCLCVKSHNVTDSIYETRKGGWHRWTVYEHEICDSSICDTFFKSK